MGAIKKAAVAMAAIGLASAGVVAANNMSKKPKAKAKSAQNSMSAVASAVHAAGDFIENVSTFSKK